MRRCDVTASGSGKGSDVINSIQSNVGSSRQLNTANGAHHPDRPNRGNVIASGSGKGSDVINSIQSNVGSSNQINPANDGAPHPDRPNRYISSRINA